MYYEVEIEVEVKKKKKNLTNMHIFTLEDVN